jgi:hypothetical protein
MNISLHVHDPRAAPHGRSGTYGSRLPSTSCLATVRLLRLCGRRRLICKQRVCQLLRFSTGPPPPCMLSSQEDTVPCCCGAPLPVGCCACNIGTYWCGDGRCAGTRSKLCFIRIKWCSSWERR